MPKPSIESVVALDGRICATLNDTELDIFRFYFMQGDRYGVEIQTLHEGLVDPFEFLALKPKDHTKRSNGRILVSVKKEVIKNVAR